MNKKKIIVSAILIVVIMLVGATGFWAWRNEVKRQEAQKVQEEQQKQQEQNETENQAGGIDTSDWKTYRNEEYGFEIRYPKNIVVTDFALGSIVFKDKETGHWKYSLDIVPNKNNMTLNNINGIKNEFNISGDVSIDDMVINGVLAKKFLFKDYNDYGNSNIFLIYKDFIIRIAGDEAHGNDKEYYTFVNSLKFDK